MRRKHGPREHNRCFPQVCPHSSSSVPGEKRLSACSCAQPRCVLPGIASRLGILRKIRLLSSLQADTYCCRGWLWCDSYLLSGKRERQAARGHSSQNWNAIFVSKKPILADCLLPPFCHFSERQFEMDQDISSVINSSFSLFLFPVGSFPTVCYYLNLFDPQHPQNAVSIQDLPFFSAYLPFTCICS